jgi:hypothetical protein
MTSNKSYMTADLFREKDIVSPTYGQLVGVRGTVSKVVTTDYGHQLIVIRFEESVRKYPNQSARLEWAYDPDSVRLESFGEAKYEYPVS